MTDQILVLADGRRLGFATNGDPDGRPAIYARIATSADAELGERRPTLQRKPSWRPAFGGEVRCRLTRASTSPYGSYGEISGAHVSEATALWLQTMVPLTARVFA